MDINDRARFVRRDGKIDRSISATAALRVLTIRFDTRRPDNVIDRFEDSKRKVKVARKDLLPSLSIVADAALKDQFYSSFQTNEYSANAGLKLNLPFDQLTERTAYRSSLIAFERQLRTLASELDKLLVGLRTDIRN